MSDNIQLYDAHLNLWTLRTTDSAGIHEPHHVTRLIDQNNQAYGPARPVPVAIYSTTGVAITIEAGSIAVSTHHDSDSVAVFGSLTVDNPSNFRSLVVDAQGLLHTTVMSGPGFASVGDSPSIQQGGVVVLGVQVGSQPASQVSGDGRTAPLIMDDQGRVFVAFGASVAVLPFTQKGDLLTYDGFSEAILPPTVDNGLLVLDSSASAGLRWLSPVTSSPSPVLFLREDLAWAVPAGGAPVGPASGDLGGAYPGPVVVAIQGTGVGATTPTTGQVLLYSGTQWSPGTLPSVITDHGLLSGLSNDDHSQYTLVSGARAFTGDQSVGGNLITSLASPLIPSDAANKGYVDAQIPTVVTNHGALTGLSDDDHLLYHTDGRALTWLVTRSTDDITEGSANYYLSSPERLKLADVETGATADQSPLELLSAILLVDGSGSLLDSDKLDGQSSSYYRSVDNHTSGTLNKLYSAAEKIKLTGIEASADVTDVTNVTAAGALMDSEVDANIKTLVLPATTTISDFGATLLDDTSPAVAQVTLGLVIGADVAAYETVTGTSFPGSPSDGDRFYRTDLSCWFYYDSGRAKWLGDALYTYQGAYLGTLTDNYDYLDANQIPYTATLGHLAPVNLCVVSATAAIAATSTCTVQLRDDGSSVATLALTTATRGVTNSLNSATIATSSVVSIYISGTATGGHAVVFHARRTEI